MNVSLILAHPKEGSFNHAIARAAIDALRAAGHSVSFHDLYREGFDPVLPYEEIPKGAEALRCFLWAASADRPDYLSLVASSVVLSDSTKNKPQRHKDTKMYLHIDD